MAVERPRKTLLEETRIGTFLLRNHFLRPATWEGMADEQGRPTVRLLRVYQRKWLMAGLASSLPVPLLSFRG
jgi:2,4-dienoyl-CoA reductase-like NADH-dependent reductase (Old Yellow Enzyme family)